MILSATETDVEATGFLADLCDLFTGNAWTIFAPPFIQFGSEQEHEARRIPRSSGDAYRVSSDELRVLLTEGRVGFDWTDLCVSKGVDEPCESGDLCYLQCVDGATWYARTTHSLAVQVLEARGFVRLSRDTLPFPAQT
jgi:hypothetical protein